MSKLKKFRRVYPLLLFLQVNRVKKKIRTLFFEDFFEECLGFSSDSLGEKESGVSGLAVVRAAPPCFSSSAAASSALMCVLLSSILFSGDARGKDGAAINGAGSCGGSRQDLLRLRPQLKLDNDSDNDIRVLRSSRICETMSSSSVAEANREVLDVAACSIGITVSLLRFLSQRAASFEIVIRESGNVGVRGERRGERI